MSCRDSIKRRILRWEDVTTVEWFPVLECGHEPFKYGGGLSEESKDKYGDTYECYECGELEKQIADTEERLAELKLRRSRK